MVMNYKNTKRTIKKIKKMSDEDLRKFIEKCTSSAIMEQYYDIAIEEAFERDMNIS